MVPFGLQPLVERHGGPVDVEDARARWSELVTAAEAGTITLITRDRYQWAALVPMSEVAEISPNLPTWPVSDARAKLGHLVGEVHGLDIRVQVLTRHRRPVAALIDPCVLVDRSEPADRRPRRGRGLMTTEANTDPFDIGPADTPEQRIAYLEQKFHQHRTDPGVPVLGEEELLVVAELLDRLNELTNPNAVTRDPWGRLARLTAVRIYDRLGI